MKRAAVSVLLIASLGVAACTSEEGSPSAEPHLPETDVGDRVAFGCALERGIEDSEAITRHYGNLAARHLFRAALAADPGNTVAATLWNASDAIEAEGSPEARSNLLTICTSAGFSDTAGVEELGVYMCAMSADLLRERPTLSSFGPADTPSKPGDPRRADATFVGTALFLLAMKADAEWYDVESPLVAVDAEDDSKYQAALRDLDTQCAKH